MKKLATLIVLILMLFSIQTIAYADYESHGSFKSKFYGPVPVPNPFIAWIVAVLR